MLVLEIEASKPPRNDLKSVSTIETTHLYDARDHFTLYDPKTRPSCQHKVYWARFVWGNGLYQVWRFIFTTLSWSILYRDFFLNDRLLTNFSVEYSEKTFFKGAGANKIKTRIERSIFCRFSAVWALLLKIQTAITSSNYTPLVT